jgi:hypothetical protein
MQMTGDPPRRFRGVSGGQDESGDRFKTRPPAEDRFREVAATGRFVRLIVWNENEATELERANAPLAR